MLDADQIAQMEKRMHEEHARDIEALEQLKSNLHALRRLRRFTSEETDNGSRESTKAANVESSIQRGQRTGLKDEIAEIVNSGVKNRIWTRPEIKHELDKRGFAIRAKDHVAAINQALRRLVERGDVMLLSHGSGSALSEYAPKRQAGVPESEDGPDVESGGRDKSVGVQGPSPAPEDA